MLYICEEYNTRETERRRFDTMFDIDIAVQKHQQLQADKINGLPDKPIRYDEPVQQIDDTNINEQAECEGIAISRAYRSRTHIRLKRTYKIDGDTFCTGERHRLVGRNA